MDPTAILTSAGTALSIIKTIADMSTDVVIKSKTIEANSAIITIQSGLITMQKESLELQQENDKLKKTIEQFNNWEETKILYELIKTERGAIVYRPNKSNPQQEPQRFYCPSCFEKRSLSIIQHVSGNNFTHQCPDCKTTFKVDGSNDIHI